MISNFSCVLKWTIFKTFNPVSRKFSRLSMEIIKNLNVDLKSLKEARGMTVLDKSKFDIKVPIPYLLADDKNVKISSLMPTLKKYLLKLQHFKSVKKISDGDDSKTQIYLNPVLVKSWTDLECAVRTHLEDLSVNESCFKINECTIGYENFTAYEILKVILPEEEDGFSSYTVTGHIVHVNLREHLLPFKNLIGQVLLDKIATCRTVVNKVNTIDNTYRNFHMEVLCGDTDFVVEVKENRCKFQFDYSTVYWNSRLSTEHERIVNMVKPEDVLFDVFAGVGPFAVPCAKKKCIVYANDLNPESYKWLNHNAKINKVDGNLLKTYNKDARDFIQGDIKSEMVKYLKTSHHIHIVMNLPATALEFLKYFVGLYSNEMEELKDFSNPPTVHVYCFTKGDDCINLAKTALFQNINLDISDKIIEVFKVRTVSNFKEMVRISFKLDGDILFARDSKKRKFEQLT